MAQEKILTVKLARLSVTRLTIGPSLSLTYKSRSLWRVITLSTLLYSSESLLWSFCLRVIDAFSYSAIYSLVANSVTSKHKYWVFLQILLTTSTNNVTSIVVNTLTSIIPNTFTSGFKKSYKHCCRYFLEQAQILFQALLQMLLTESRNDISIIIANT